jgi:hypothetical protein
VGGGGKNLWCFPDSEKAKLAFQDQASLLQEKKG